MGLRRPSEEPWEHDGCKEAGAPCVCNPMGVVGWRKVFDELPAASCARGRPRQLDEPLAFVPDGPFVLEPAEIAGHRLSYALVMKVKLTRAWLLAALMCVASVVGATVGPSREEVAAADWAAWHKEHPGVWCGFGVRPERPWWR
jgi:hypothetical protein